jgi:hypothetical protein
MKKFLALYMADTAQMADYDEELHARTAQEGKRGVDEVDGQ